MKIKSAVFIKGVVGQDELFSDGIPQIAFIGRSNVGKSSTINTLTQQPGLARTSSFPGRTQQINVFLINKAWYLLDLPGYGFTKHSWDERAKLHTLITGYLFNKQSLQKKVVLIIDAHIGLSDNDFEMLHSLEDWQKDLVVVANKVDKIKPADQAARLAELQTAIGNHLLIPFSAQKKIGVQELADEIFKVIPPPLDSFDGEFYGGLAGTVAAGLATQSDSARSKRR